MDYREATPDDAEAIREAAHASLHASYEAILGEDAIHEALDRWYAVEDLREEIAAEGGEDERLFVVGERDGEVVGFAQSYVRHREGRIEWLHVHPDARDGGVGAGLLEATRARLADRGVERITGEVLADNEEGTEFYEDHGFSLEDQVTVSIGGSFFAENRYVDVADRPRDLVAVETAEGTMYADESDPHRGRDAPFFPVYRGEDGTRRWGWYCSHCESTDTAMDTLERVVCNECGNVRKAARWDAAYL